MSKQPTPSAIVRVDDDNPWSSTGSGCPVMASLKSLSSLSEFWFFSKLFRSLWKIGEWIRNARSAAPGVSWVPSPVAFPSLRLYF
jgi:hypothetical protein